MICMLLFSFSLVFAQGGGPVQYGECGDNVCDYGENTSSYPYYCPEDCDTDSNDNITQEDKNNGLGQMIRNRVKAGVYTNEAGEQMRVSEMAQNRLRLNVNSVDVECECNLTQEKVQNRTRLKVKLNNGRNAEVKIMPDSASQTALNRLRIRNCNEENNCSIELKEVGQGKKSRLSYEVQAEKHAKLLGMFRMKMQVRAEVDAENGELVRVNKPWWAFLASEAEE